MADERDNHSGSSPSGDTPGNPDRSNDSSPDSGGGDRGDQEQTGQPAKRSGNRGNIESLRAYHEARRLAKQNGDGAGSSGENRSSASRGSGRTKRKSKRSAGNRSERDNSADSDRGTQTQAEIDIEADRVALDDDEPAPRPVKKGKVLPCKAKSKGQSNKDIAKAIQKFSSVASNFIGHHWEISQGECDELAAAIANLPISKDSWLVEMASKYEPYVGFAIVSGSIVVPRLMYSIAMYQAAKAAQNVPSIQTGGESQAQANTTFTGQTQSSPYTSSFQDAINGRYSNAHGGAS